MSPGGRRSMWPEVLGVAWVVAIPLAVLGPALFAHPSMLSDPSTGDQAIEIQPWTRLAWTEVHRGHLPLWNPFSVLGAPLAFNWQSAAFSLPVLVSYAFPIGWAFTAGILTTLVVAGTGVYVLSRLLGINVAGAAVAATLYELSGPFLGWLGWPVASVMSWMGWLLAAALLVVRGRHRLRAVALFAMVVALSVYSGQPDTLAVVAVALVLFVLALLVQRTPVLRGSGEILRPLVDLAVAVVAGAALSAPLLLPGLQVAQASIRVARARAPALPAHFLAALVVPLFNGLAVPGSMWIGGPVYVQGVATVGIIAAALAVVGVIRHRCPEVRAFAVLALAAMAAIYLPPVVWVLGHVARSVQWTRAGLILALAVAVLAGAGTDSLLRRRPTVKMSGWLLATMAGGAALLGLIWIAGRGGLTPAGRHIRTESFVWPAVTTGLGLAIVAGLYVGLRRGVLDRGTMARRGVPMAVAGLVLSQIGLLVSAGMPLWSSSSAPAPREPVQLAQVVGTAVLGFGVDRCFPYSLAILQDTNLDYGVREFDVYDPMTPKAYYQSYRAETGSSGGLVGAAGTNVSFFCPSITSVDLARLYGVHYVMEPRGTAPFPGARLVERMTTGDLYRVPGAASATLVSAQSSRAFPPASARGEALVIHHPGPASWMVRTNSASPAVLRLRLTDVPGWRATIDGRPLKTHRFSGVMLQARIPPGKHVIRLHYWPAAFTVGLVIALVTVGAFVLAGLYSLRASRLSAPRAVATAASL